MSDMSRRSPTPRRIRTRIRNALVYALVAVPGLAWADLPTVNEPTEGSGGSGLIGTLQGYGATAILFIALLLGAIAFVVAAGGAIAQFGEARQRGEWGGFATTVIVGIVMVVVVIWLGNQAIDIL